MGRVQRRRTEREEQFAKALAQAIKAKRLEKGMKVEELAASLGVSVFFIYRWQRDAQCVPVYMLIRLAACLKVPLAELVGPAIFAKKANTQNCRREQQENC